MRTCVQEIGVGRSINKSENCSMSAQTGPCDTAREDQAPWTSRRNRLETPVQ